MRKKRNMFRVLVAPLIALSCVGCVGDPIPETIQVVVSNPSNDIVFSPPSRVPSQTELDELVVWHESDASSTGLCRGGGVARVVWHVRTDIRVFKTPALVSWPLQYGARIANSVQLVPPEHLQPGHYAFCAFVRLDPHGIGMSDIKTLVAEFSVESRSMNLGVPSESARRPD
jgi:hypothetical protein